VPACNASPVDTCAAAPDGGACDRHLAAWHTVHWQHHASRMIMAHEAKLADTSHGVQPAGKRSALGAWHNIHSKLAPSFAGSLVAGIS
jgi:hypothetical protein